MWPTASVTAAWNSTPCTCMPAKLTRTICPGLKAGSMRCPDSPATSGELQALHEPQQDARFAAWWHIRPCSVHHCGAAGRSKTLGASDEVPAPSETLIMVRLSVGFSPLLDASLSVRG